MYCCTKPSKPWKSSWHKHFYSPFSSDQLMINVCNTSVFKQEELSRNVISLLILVQCRRSLEFDIIFASDKKVERRIQKLTFSTIQYAKLTHIFFVNWTFFISLNTFLNLFEHVNTINTCHIFIYLNLLVMYHSLSAIYLSLPNFYFVIYFICYDFPFFNCLTWIFI